jgi:hypothetical protein
MRRSSAILAGSILAAAIYGCSFNPDRTGGPTGGGGANGGGGSSGASSGHGGSGAAGSGGNGLTGGTGNSGGDIGTDAGNCGQMSVGTTNLPPDLLLVQDKSGSMANDFNDMMCGNANPCGATNPVKWTALTQALTTVINQTQNSVRWGLKYFANNNQCQVNAGATIGIGSNNAAANILTSLAATNPGGFTPTGAAMHSAGTYMAGLTDPNPKYILLATDGQPNCVPVGSTNNDPTAVNAVTDVFNQGFKTFVIGVGNVQAAQTTLNTMAMNGGEAQPADAQGRVFFPADNPAALEAALTAITGHIASCTFTFNPAVPPPAPDNIVVLGDNNPIPKDPTNGWSYGANMTSVDINGTYCDMIKSGAIQVVGTIFGCPMMSIIVP